MNKFNIAALVAVAAVVIDAFVQVPLTGFLSGVGMIYLTIYGAIKLGVGIANSISMLAYEKTINENMAEGGDYGNKNAKCLGAGFACVATLVVMLVCAINSVPYAAAATIMFGLAVFATLVFGYQAKRFRDGDYNGPNFPS